MEQAMDEEQEIEETSEETEERTHPIDREPPPAVDWAYETPAVPAAEKPRASMKIVIIAALLAGLIGGVVGAFAVPRSSGVSVERISQPGSSVGQTTLTGV